MRPPGIVVGVWRIAELISNNGSVEVYSAMHLSLPIAAAVKILVAGDASRRSRFEFEESFLRHSESGAFPRLLGSGEYDGCPYIATEFLKPLALPTEDAEVERFILAVARGIREMHLKGYAHGSLKPEAVMKRANGAPVIVKLGKLTGSQSDDIRALGELIRACYMGHPPFCWGRVVAKATTPLAGERYSSAADFIYGVKTRAYLMRTTIAILSFLAIAAAAVLVVFLAFHR